MFQIQDIPMPYFRIVLAAILFFIILTLPPATKYDSYIEVLSNTAMTLKGQQAYSDVAQDFYGFRALLTNQDPYARLKPALKTIGVDWRGGSSSTHPPTAFLLVAPIAYLPWKISSMLWAWMMLVCLCLSLRFGLGYSWDRSMLITVAAMYWIPISTSFGQLTMVWMFGLAMAYRYRNDHPFLSGLLIGIASFTKLLPAILLLPFLLRQKWEAIKGFVLIWLVAAGILFLLSPKTILHYVTTNRTNTAEIIARLDNGSFLFFLYRRAGMIGLVITAITLLLLLILAFIKHHQTSEKEISKEEWNIYAFLSVLVMPITWIFSIAPLFPNVLLLLQDKRWIVRGFAICALIPPMLVLPWGTQSTLGLFGFFSFAGTALVLSQSGFTLSRQLSNVPSE
jgi:hypothetical protein